MSVYDFTVTDATGSDKSLSDYTGRPLLIVNVASQCGFTPQYEGLESLHRKYAPQGLQLLGFPCNQFGAQEPGTDTEIQDFCSTNYGVTFPVLSKIEVNGPGADPLYQHLREQAPGDFSPETGGMLYEHVKATNPAAIGTDDVKWNFTKFLVGRDGQVICRYESTVTPEEIRDDLSDVL